MENNFATALEFYREALRRGLNPDEHLEERWTCLMQLGLFEAAWQETDRTENQRRTFRESTKHLPPHVRRVWDGTPLAGKRVLVRCFHGLGDTIQFVRYLNPLSQITHEVIVEAQSSLLRLLENSAGTEQVRFRNPVRDLVDCEAEVELMELAYCFRTSLETIPANEPYLHVPEETAARRHAELTRLGLCQSTLNVGLVWSSGDWNPDRNIGLEKLRCLSDIAEVQLFSLQRGPATQQLKELNLGSTIMDAETEEDECGNPLRTAAAIVHLDLVISVDTMVAHLTGALGKPVWMLLPYRADWRWMADREDSPWYPTMRLFRQSRAGDWSDAVERVHRELIELARQKQGRCGQTSSGCGQTSSGSISLG